MRKHAIRASLTPSAEPDASSGDPQNEERKTNKVVPASTFQRRTSAKPEGTRAMPVMTDVLPSHNG